MGRQAASTSTVAVMSTFVTTLDAGGALLEPPTGEAKTTAMTIVLEATQSIELKVGGSTIKMTPSS